MMYGYSSSFSVYMEDFTEFIETFRSIKTSSIKTIIIARWTNSRLSPGVQNDKPNCVAAFDISSYLSNTNPIMIESVYGVVSKELLWHILLKDLNSCWHQSK